MTGHPLSHGQLGLWYLQRLLPDNVVYNVPLGLRILSALDVAGIRRLCQSLVDRHPSLRTTYALQDRDPVQIVHQDMPVRLQIIEGADWPEDVVAGHLAQETYRPFDLERGPMMRATLLTREAGRHLLLLVFHHIAIDLWSLTLLVEEMGRLSRAWRDGTPPDPPPAATYLDFVRWNRTLLAGPKGEQLWGYWRRQFAGQVEPVVLPVDFEARASDATAGTVVPWRLGRELSGGLRRVAQQIRSTLNVVLLAAFETLLHRYSGQQEFLLRTLAAGRSRAEFEPVIGFFTNPVVLRADFTGEPTFAELVARVRLDVSGAIEHQDFPFELLLERLGLERVIRYNPNPRAMFVLQAPHRLLEEQRSQSRLAERGVFAAGDTGVRLDLGGLIVEKHNPPQRMTLNDLALEMVELGGELCAALHYRSDLFREETIARFAEHYQQLLVQVVANPNRPVSVFRFEPEIVARRRGGHQPASTEPTVPPAAITASGSPGPGAGGASATPEEAELSRIFTEVLGGRTIGVHENFFDSGGHSLLALQLIARVRDAFQIDLPLGQLFDVPTISGLALVLRGARRSNAPEPIRPAARAGPVPLSFAQERLWFQDRLEGAPLLIPLALRIGGPLDPSALARSFDEVISRHEVLRTTLRTTSGEPVQVVNPPWRLEIPVTGVDTVPEKERPVIVEQLAAAQAAEPFDLERGPLVRARLLRFAPDDHVLLLSFHHAVADGWSLGVLLAEISRIYAAIVCGERPALPPLPIQYADYARWQRENWESGRLQGQLDYWRAELAGLTPLALPTSRPRPAVQAFQGASRSFTVEAGVTEALRRLGQREGTTLFMTVLAVFQTLVHRYTGQTDIVVGSPIAGRGRAELEGLVGCFLNMLVLRSDVSGNPAFRDFVRRVRDTCLRAYAHQDLPFEKLVEHLQPARDLTRQPLFQVMFVLQNAPMPPLRLTGEVVLTPLEIPRRVTNYDLTLFVTETEAGLNGLVEYSPALFDAEKVDRMIRHLKQLLSSVADDPARRVSDLALMDADEQRQILHQWSGAAEPGHAPACVHTLIEARAAMAPLSVAVESRSGTLTYAELNARANRLARCLASRGAGAHAIVAVELERSPALLAALLAAWKTGAAYVYLDPSHPRGRRDAIVTDTAAAILISDCRRDGAGDVPSTTVLAGLEELCRKAATQPASNLDVDVTPDRLAYVAYTSGSTGRPKGVMVAHAALSNYLRWCASSYEMEAGTGVPFYTSPAFDFAATTLFAPLVAGQRVVVVPDAEAPGIVGTLAGPREWTLLKLTPSFASALGGPGAGQSVPRARFVVFGGERLSGEHVRAWQRCTQPVTVVNEYGPTEATIGCCAWRARATEVGEGNVPIGTPIPGARVYVLGRWLEPVPAGVPGELFVAGCGLALGYLNRPDLTAERFLADPFSPHPGERMYRTGDLVRWRPDGVLEYLGRRDDQVKVRGFRVEPAEVEGALLSLPGVRQAAVVAAEDAPAGSRLLGYVVCQPQHAADGADIRAALRQTLPEHMIPSSVLRLDALPVDANGKLDRRALVEMSARAPDRMGPSTAPRTEIERQVAAAWADALHLDRVSIDDDFFDLGGHSLLAVRVAARLAAHFGNAVSLIDLFQARTVADLAGLIERRTSAAGQSQVGRAATLVRLSDPRAAQSPTLLCFHPSGGAVGCYRELAGAVRHAMSVVGVQSRALGCARLEHDSLESMAEEYARLIRDRGPQGPLRLLGWSMGAAVAAHVAAVLERDGQAVESVTMLDPGFRATARMNAAATAADVAAALTEVAQTPLLAEIDERVVADLVRSYAQAARRRPGRRIDAVVSVLRKAVPAAGPELLEFAREQILLVERHETLLSATRFPTLGCPVSVLVSKDIGPTRREAIVCEIAPGARVGAMGVGHYAMLAQSGAAQVARFLMG
jgi:amino acid adenylation domain-containing protein